MMPTHRFILIVEGPESFGQAVFSAVRDVEKVEGVQIKRVF